MATTGQAGAPKLATLESVRAIPFDVQITCVDFCQSILNMGEDINRAKNFNIDWSAVPSERYYIYRVTLDNIIEFSFYGFV